MIAIILVNWNGSKDTIACLESLLRLEDGNYVVFVVDNASTDGSLEAISAWAASPEGDKPTGGPWVYLAERRRWPARTRRVDPCDRSSFTPGEIILVDAGANLGFAGANNIGLALARQDSRIDYAWLLNNDTVVAADSLTALRKHAHNNPQAAMIGARLMFYHQPDMVQGVGGIFNPWRAQGGHIGMGGGGALPKVEDIEAQMNYIIGASIFLPMAVYDEIGPMEESYFLYFEEPDWAYRLERAGQGKRLTVALDAVVYHKEGGSIGSCTSRRPSDLSIYYKNRNLWRFMWRWHRQLLPLTFWWQLYEIAHFLRRGDLRAVEILLRAFRDAVTGRGCPIPISRS